MTAGTDFGAPPPAGGSSSYLGVPSGYAYLPRQNRSGFNIFGALGMPTFGDQSGSVAGQPVAPRYQTGDELSIASMPPEQLARLQQQMATAGLIGPSTKVRVGLADDATLNAFKAVLSFANVNGMDWQSALDEMVANPPVDTTPKVTQKEAPANEDAALYSEARTLIGKNPSQQQLMAFRPYYDALTQSAQLQAQQAQTPTTGQLTDAGSLAPPSVTAAPNVSDAAQSFLRTTDPLEVQGESLSHVMDALHSLINGAGEGNFGQKGNG